MEVAGTLSFSVAVEEAGSGPEAEVKSEEGIDQKPDILALGLGLGPLPAGNHSNLISVLHETLALFRLVLEKKFKNS